jgi:L-ascorbate metabolism protein UlaG (beta-lactamase superfamily)
MKASGAPIIFNKSMIQQKNGQTLMLGPRSKGLAFDTPVSNFRTLSADETIAIDGMKITGIKTSHGPLTLKIGPVKKTEQTGSEERIGWGNIGFKINYKGKTVVNLGDTLLHVADWERIKNPDILMIPIGGSKIGNTMNEKDALEAVQIIQPKMVIPMHYNCPMLFSKNGNPADDMMFIKEVNKLGMDCMSLQKGKTVNVA